MPDWLAIVFAGAGGIVTLAGAAAVFWRPVHRLAGQWGRMDRAINGEPGRQGLVDQVRALADQVDAIEKQTLPNGGASLRDSLTRVERHVAEFAVENRAQNIELRDLKTSTRDSISRIESSLAAVRRAYVEREHRRGT